MIQGGVVNIKDATLNMPVQQVNGLANRDKGMYQGYQLYLYATDPC